jgi:hypothetical protein
MADPTTNDLPFLLEIQRRAAAGEDVPEDVVKKAGARLRTYAQQGLYKPNAGLADSGLPIRDIRDNERNALTEVMDTFSAQRDLLANFKDEYAGSPILGALENTAQSKFSSVGSPGQSLFWKKFGLYDSLERNKLFGAALTATEKQSWENTTVGPGDDPKIVKDKILTRYTLARTAASRLAGVAEAGGVSPKIVEQIIPRDLRQEIDRPKTHVINIDGEEFSFQTTADASMEDIQTQGAQLSAQNGGPNAALLNPLATSPAEQRDTTLGAIDAAVRGATDSLTLGADNKIVSALNSVIPLDRLSGRDVKSVWDGASLGDAYQYNLARENEVDALDEQVNPAARAAGQIGGGILGLGKVNAAVKGGGKLGTAAVDAGLGFIYGANQASDKTSDANEIVVEGLKTGGSAALGGQVVRVAGDATGKLFTGAQNATANFLKSKGISLTPGGILGGATKTVEDALTSVPVVRDVINARRGDSVKDFNRAVMSEAMTPIGAEAPKDIGEKGVLYMQEKVGEAFTNALGGVKLSVDDAYKKEMGAVLTAAKDLPEDLRDKFTSMMKTRVDKLFQRGEGGAPTLSGEFFQDALSGIRKDVSSLYKRGEVQADVFDGVASQAEEALINLAKRQSPGTAEALDAANQAYRNKSIVQKAVLSGQNTDGVFTAAQLGRASTSNTLKFGGENAAAAGQRPFFDLQRAAQNTLPATLPDSGTATRALVANTVGFGGLAGAGGYGVSQDYIDPSTAVGIAALTLPFTRTGNKAVSSLLTQRPEVMRQIGQSMQESGIPRQLGTTVGALFAAPEKEAAFEDPKTGILYDKDGKPIRGK